MQLCVVAKGVFTELRVSRRTEGGSRAALTGHPDGRQKGALQRPHGGLQRSQQESGRASACIRTSQVVFSHITARKSKGEKKTNKQKTDVKN